MTVLPPIHSRSPLFSADAPATHGGSSQAFTLMELLVVIGIIAVLAGLLLPVVSGIQGNVRKSESSNNLRQLVVAARLYAAENNNFPPFGQGGTMNNQTWPMWLAHYMDFRPSVIPSPSSVIHPPNWNGLTGKRPEGVFANPVSPYLVRSGNISDYGINNRLSGHWVQQGRFSFSQIAEPSRVLLFAEVNDCNRSIRDGWATIEPMHDNGKTALVAYVDGHVGSLTKEEVDDAIQNGTQNTYPWGWEGRHPDDAQKHNPE